MFPALTARLHLSPPPPFPEAADKQSAGVAAQRREGDQQEKPPVPPSVEEVAGPYDEEVLRPQAAVEHEPVEQEDDREEQREFERIEKHGSKHDLRQIAGVGVCRRGVTLHKSNQFSGKAKMSAVQSSVAVVCRTIRRPTGHSAQRFPAQYSVASCNRACDSKALRGRIPADCHSRM